MAVNELYKSSVGNSAAGHNSIFRGKNLGTSYTSAMSKAIQNGTFDDLYVGDYLTINGTVYRIAGFNIIKNCGDNVSIGNNMCLVPDSALYNAQMHNTDSGQYTEALCCKYNNRCIRKFRYENIKSCTSYSENCK